MEDASKICHHCDLEVEKDTFFVAISIKHNSQKYVHDVALLFHLPCFTEVAGEEYERDLALKIENWISGRKKEKALLDNKWLKGF